jgi:hypothetical protein
MVKNIMQWFGGKIWFSPAKDRGTVFYLEFKTAGEKMHLNNPR